ncbi:hypothetical protein [Streptomyces sp. NPDC049813]|uniref:hypothetical protein n=1 Tax=Streptomyces sp. NPDC049813 TaxID=3365597 RepID=UPI0037AD7429
MDELNAVERRLWRVFARGAAVDAGGGAPEAESAVRAEVLAALLLGDGPDAEEGARPALRLTGAHITGRLDLRLGDLPVPILLDSCRFDEAPRMQGARMRDVALTGCALPGLDAGSTQIDGRLDLPRSRLRGPLVLTRAEIRGTWDLRATTVTARAWDRGDLRRPAGRRRRPSARNGRHQRRPQRRPQPGHARSSCVRQVCGSGM